MRKRNINGHNIYIFETPEVATTWMADQIVEDASKIDAGKYNVALSGGSTPSLLFSALAKSDPNAVFLRNLNWFWGDERMVSPDDDQSNYKDVNERLFSKVPISFSRVFRIRGEENICKERIRYIKVIDSVLPKRNEYPAFDLMILGLGTDGHTASIFPNNMDLLMSHDWVEIAKHPESGQFRLTLTGEVLKNSFRVVFLVTGESKAEVLSDIVNKKGKFREYPAAYVKPRSGNLLWIIDEAAASRL
ncbi:6-phosphogluconolactonase [Saccharicrinis sp. FJH2]|uniref:6-phosphogluconolactonase n=1 Tax=unclassified Saccharicrinis TaxID=2646859 RepID=UPI0035D4BC7B